jgi:hypothetical protein
VRDQKACGGHRGDAEDDQRDLEKVLAEKYRIEFV